MHETVLPLKMGTPFVDPYTKRYPKVLTAPMAYEYIYIHIRLHAESSAYISILYTLTCRSTVIE